MTLDMFIIFKFQKPETFQGFKYEFMNFGKKTVWPEKVYTCEKNLCLLPACNIKKTDVFHDFMVF